MLARIGDLLGRGIDAGERGGAQRFAISSLNAPVPQPTSSQRAFAGAPSQARNFSPMARLQRPMKRS